MAGRTASDLSPPLCPRPPAPSPPARSPVGARWVAGLGAFLLVAAAATFVAVRWADIPDSAKLGALLAVTATCLVVHRHLRTTLPVTGAALFHLGVFLVPIDVAAIGVWGRWEWPAMLLAQGLVGTVTFAAAARTERSVVLRWGTWAAVVMLAGGIGAVTTVPAGLALAAVALAAVACHRWLLAQDPELDAGLELGASAWAVLAGLAVPLAGAEQLGWPAAGVLVDLGLAGEPPHPTAAATGLVAAAALFVVAHRRLNLMAALTGVACALVGVTTAWVSIEPSVQASLVALATVCLLAEVAGFACRPDRFWRQTSDVVASLGEVVAGGFSFVHAGIVLAAPLAPLREPVAGLAAGLVALTWVAATARRSATSLAMLAAAASSSAAVAMTTGSSTATGITVAVGASIVLLVPYFLPSHDRGPVAGISTAPPTGRVLAAGLLGWAPLAAWDHPPVAAALAIAGSLVVAEAAVWATRATRSAAHTASVPIADAAFASSLGFLALGPLATGAIALANTVDGTATAAIAGVVLALWAVAAILDRAEQLPTDNILGYSVPSLPLSLVPRAAMVVPLLLATGLPLTHAAGVGALVAALALLDAFRLDEPLLLVGAGAALPLTVASLAVASDWTLAEAGIGVTLLGIAWLGVSGTLSERWLPPAIISAGIAGIVGMGLALDDPAVLATNLLLVGATIALLGVAVGQTSVIVAGLAVTSVGLWGHLTLADVRASEPYVAPVALLLVFAGMHARRELEASSWVAYSAPIVLLGGTALVERLAGRPAWHALVAGAVGVLAVVAGGAWRLGAPLLLGSVLVVATTMHETLGVTAAVPTWAWLAIGGAALLAAGVTMERQGLGPSETGRRLLEVVRERFA